MPEETRTAVIDLGSNTFRLVVFTAAGRRWWKRVDEIYEPVRISAGMGPSGELQPAPMERALGAIDEKISYIGWPWVPFVNASIAAR